MKQLYRATIAAAVLSMLVAIGVFASTASALPEISPTPTKTAPLTFTASLTRPTIEREVSGEWTCAKANMNGEFVSSTEVEAKIEFVNCPGFISPDTTTFLKGQIGYVTQETSQTGLALVGALTQELVLKSFGNEIFEGKDELLGGVIGNLTPLNTTTKTLELEYNGKNGKQELTHLACRKTTLECIEAVENKERTALPYVLKDLHKPVNFKATFPVREFKKAGKAVEVEIKA